MSLSKLTKIQRKRLQNHQDTIILVLGSPRDDAAMRLAKHIRDEVTTKANDSEYINPENLERVPAAYKEADEGDTILIAIGRVLESNPPIARTLKQTLSMMRHNPTTTILISERPAEALRSIANFEVTPVVVGEVEAVTPSREVPDEVERIELDEIRVSEDEQRLTIDANIKTSRSNWRVVDE